MKPLSIFLVCMAQLACQPTASPESISHALIGSWRVEQIQAKDQTAAFFSRSHFRPQTQPDLLSITFSFWPDGILVIGTVDGPQTGTWQVGKEAGTIDMQLTSHYRLTNVRCESNVLTFQSADLTSFLGNATYTLRQ